MKYTRLLRASFFIISLIILFFILLNIKKTPKPEADKLLSLTYINWAYEYANASQMSVTVYEKDLSFEGYTLFQDILIDMQGNVVWNITELKKSLFTPAFLDNIIIALDLNRTKVFAFNKNMSILWERNLTTHHDYTITPSGDILFISSSVKNYNGYMVEFDDIYKISKKGEIIDFYSTYDSLSDLQNYHPKTPLDNYSSREILLESAHTGTSLDGEFDYYHTNFVQEIPNNQLDKIDRRFQRGNLLLSLRTVRTIVIIDKDTHKIVWSYNLKKHEANHAPQMLESGNILFFENGDEYRNFSRIIELNPITSEIEWEYTENPKEKFYSIVRGYAQRLKNGNTLIVESARGRVFEVTKNKKIVWEWYNPSLNDLNKRAVVPIAIRYPKNFLKYLVNTT